MDTLASERAQLRLKRLALDWESKARRLRAEADSTAPDHHDERAELLGKVGCYNACSVALSQVILTWHQEDRALLKREALEKEDDPRQQYVASLKEELAWLERSNGSKTQEFAAAYKEELAWLVQKDDLEEEQFLTAYKGPA